MAQFGCGGSRCTCQVTAGPGVTVTGNGSTGAPYVIEATAGAVTCDQVRPCISAGDGASYDPDTGVVAARPSTDAGNTLGFGTDGGLLVPPAGAPAVEAGDTDTVDTTVTGTGAPGDPFVVSADVKLDPSPPQGGTNLIGSGADGLFLECADVRGCISAGDGIAYDPGTGVLAARPSTDAGNTLGFGTDGGLLVPPADPLEVGCGLQGDGTTAAPLAAFPVAGEQPWTDDWDCDAAANSTLKCDPGTGALWTPPEHTSGAVTLQQLHPLGTPAIGPTSGFIIIDSTAWSEGRYTADSLSTCRGVSFSTRFTGHVEVSWTADAVFDLGYGVSINGAAPVVRQTHSKLTAGQAGRERWSFGIAQASVLAPHTSYAVRVFPAINVTAGTVTIRQWITDTDLIALTR